MLQVHRAQARDPGLDNNAGRPLSGFRSHKSAKTRPRFRADSIGKRGFQGRQARRREISDAGQFFHRSVAAARRNEGCRSGSAVEGKIKRAFGPVERFFLAHEGRLDQDEDAQVDVVLAQEAGRRCELIRGHSLVEPFENLRMDGFQAHRDFEAAGQLFLEAEAVFADQRWMAFDDDAFECGNAAQRWPDSPAAGMARGSKKLPLL